MTSRTVRSLLALIVVGGFTLVSFLVIGLMVYGRVKFPDGYELLKNFSSVFSGFVGLVLGYYFASSQKDGEDPRPAAAEQGVKTEVVSPSE